MAKVHMDHGGPDTSCGLSIEKAIRWIGIVQAVKVTTDPDAVTCGRPGCFGSAQRARYVAQSTVERHAEVVASFGA